LIKTHKQAFNLPSETFIQPRVPFKINNSMFKTAQFPELALDYLVWYGEKAVKRKQYFESH
jgi:hypothetical protein